MRLTSGQQLALDSIRGLQKTHPNGGGVGCVSGYAGTGKTSLIKVLADELDDDLLVCCPTGKACVRVREAAEAKSKTIHSWLYEVTEDEKTGALNWGLKQIAKMERPRCGFLLVDEASMVTHSVFCDLYGRCRDLGLNLVLVGDGFQLPPVETDLKRAGFSVFSPDMPASFKVQLTEIHRQALDSPIIRASMALRQGQFAGEALSDLPLVLESKLQEEARLTFESEGVVIVHRNVTRHALNNGIRADMGKGAAQLEKGEPLLVTQNNYQLETFNGETVTSLTTPTPINASPVAVHDAHTTSSAYVNFLQVQVDTPLKGRQVACVADREVFGTLGTVGAFAVKRAAQRLLLDQYGHTDDGEVAGPPYLQANVGYVLTCHKSQGSSWRHGIVVIEPSLRLGTNDGRRWAYTALTRFEKEARICWLSR